MFDFLIKERFTDVFSRSSVQILKGIRVGTTALIQQSNSSMPTPGTLYNRTGDLARDIASNENITGIVSDGVVVAEKKLSLPYGYLVSRDASEITPRQRSFFWAMYFNTRFGSTNWYSKMWKTMALFGKVIRGRGLVYKSMENYDIKPVIKKEIRKEFMPKKKVVTIGN